MLKKVGYGTLAILFTITALAVSALPAVPRYSLEKPKIWLLVMGILFVALVFISKATTGFGRGLWIDDRYKMNLSRVQLALWTLLIISAYLTAAMSNAIIPDPKTKDKSDKIKASRAALDISELNETAAVQKAAEAKTAEANKAVDQAKDLTTKARESLKGLEVERLQGPLEVAIPTAVWLLLGISLASFVGSPMLLNDKKAQPTSAAELVKAKDALRSQGYPEAQVSQIENLGKVLVNTSPSQAGFGDLFRGEETGNAGTLDLGKVQLFFFTVVVLFVYASGLFILFSTGGPVHEFPGLDTSTLALLGMSNAGYLANKAAPQGPPAKPADPVPPA